MRRYLLVVGVELEFLLEREADGAEVLPGTIPSAIASCLLEVEARGSSEVGICESVFLSWRQASMRPRSHCRSYFWDMYAIGDMIKSWFRLLPVPVFPSSAYFAIMLAQNLLLYCSPSKLALAPPSMIPV